MGTGERELAILVVIEFCFPPVGFLVAVFALFAKLSAMVVIIFMATKTFSCCGSVFRVWLVAPVTGRCFVRARESKVCKLMVEGFIIQTNDVRISSFVFRMAG